MLFRLKKDGTCVNRESRFGFTFSRVTDGDKGLRFPVRGQIEGILYGLRAEEGGAHPAGAEAKGMGGEQQVLHGEGCALRRHDPFIVLASEVGVGVHVGHGGAGDDDQGGVGDPFVRAAGFLLDERFGHVVFCQILA